MRLSRFISSNARPASRSGVALIITVIMLSVITFLAVAFLALSGREKNAVKVTTDQTTARLATDTAFVRAQADLLSGILASRNLANFGIVVSTNFQNWDGYDVRFAPGTPNPTNVNYYLPDGSPLSGDNARQNLANLFYNPSAPVFVTNRFFLNSNEFRSYIDLNRNGRLDLTGFWGVTNKLNRALTDSSDRFVTNFVTGDPQWIGGTERIELPHSPTNKFIYRFAYMAVPVGNTLDLNYIHDNVTSTAVSESAFFRNQGVGSWELNLAAFLVDLNTNYWLPQSIPIGSGGYTYEPLGRGRVGGLAFKDAASLLSYRYGHNLASLYSFSSQFPGVVNTFQNDAIDGYSDRPLMIDPFGIDELPAANKDETTKSWPGSDNTNHFFTTQDLFDRNKTTATPAIPGADFAGRLERASTNVSTYDQYTYYRLLSQLGTDSAPDDSDKLNLNYKNVGGVSATNFVAWKPLELFTSAADRLLVKYTQDWLDADYNYYTNFFGTNQVFGISRIPVLISNRFVYTPSVHRMLQVAANIADTKTDTLWPSVFRPIFSRDNTGLYITGYEQAPTNNLAVNYFEPTPTNAASALIGGNQQNQRINVYGVPWVVGAKKGLPNLNEVSMHSLFQITRKMQIARTSLAAPQSSWKTNIMYVVGTSNAIGIEAWNSYRNDFTNQVVVRVGGEVTMVLTNESGILLTNSFVFSGITNFNRWRGYGNSATPQAASFIVPVRTNIAFLPESVYRLATRSFTTDLNIPFEPTAQYGFPQFQWGLHCSVRLRYVMQLGNENGPILDYAQLDNMESYRNLSEEIRDPDFATGYDGLWSTNLIKNSNIPQGILNQIDVSFGDQGVGGDKWKDYNLQVSPNVALEVDFFRVLYGDSPLKYSNVKNTNLNQQVPFTPTKRVLQEFSWQANDPLVHYMANDLLDISKTNNIERPLLTQTFQLLKNIGSMNKRYSPWGGNPANPSENLNRYDIAVKDPGITSSDGWQFPTNKFPTIGWLGRVHRGTPWQTIYMKSSDLNIEQFSVPLTNLNAWVSSYPKPAYRWAEWSGNPNFYDAFYTRPATDRRLFDVFTTAFNDNASRGQLSVNQTNLAAWSAVFSGVIALANAPTNPSVGYQPSFKPVVIEPAGNYDPSAGLTLPPLVKLVSGINAERTRTFASGAVGQFVHPGGYFQSAGDILSVPALSLGAPVFVPDDPKAPWPQEGAFYWTNSSPFLDFGWTNGIRGKSDEVPVLGSDQLKSSLNDAALEWLPQQIMSLVRAGEPRFLIYAYGQALRPAENSIYTGAGVFSGLCTNYQITAEVAARAVVRVVGSANPKDKDNADPKRQYPPRLIVESYNYLPPD